MRRSTANNSDNDACDGVNDSNAVYRCDNNDSIVLDNEYSDNAENDDTATLGTTSQLNTIHLPTLAGDGDEDGEEDDDSAGACRPECTCRVWS